MIHNTTILYNCALFQVKWWNTFNEPAVFTLGHITDRGYAPSVNAPGIGNYLVLHTILLAHAKTYHMYRREFWAKQQGQFALPTLIHGVRINGLVKASVTCDGLTAAGQFHRHSVPSV
jgi:hypothetical protein